jgi:hypothetical protein
MLKSLPGIVLAEERSDFRDMKGNRIILGAVFGISDRFVWVNMVARMT